MDLYKQGIVFEKFAEMLPEMIYEVDLTGKVIVWKPARFELFRLFKRRSLKGINISEIFPESYQKMIENLKALRSPGKSPVMNILRRKKDGTLVPIVTHSFATFLDDKIIGYRGVVTDISKQKEYENQIKKEKAFLEHLIDSTPEAIAITDTSGKISMVNKEFTNLFGYTSEEAVNKYIDDLIVPDDLKEEAFTSR